MGRWVAALVAALGAMVGVPAWAETELVVASFPPFDESVKLAIPRFERLHPGVKVKLVSRALGDHHSVVITALETGIYLPDVVAVEADFIGEFTSCFDRLEDLSAPPYRAKPLLEKLVKAALHTWTRPMLIPADVGPGTLFYRKDLLDAAGVTEGELTRSWESYIEAGRRIRAQTGAFLLAHARELEEVYHRGHLRDGDTVFYNRKADPVVRVDRFRRAFALARAVRQAGLDAEITAWSSEWVSGIRDGKIATIMAGSWLSEHLEELAPDTRGQWRVAQLPGGAYATWGGSYFGIPKEAAHKAEAWAFVQFMCFDRAQQVEAWRKRGAWPALLAAQDDPFVDEPVPFLAISGHGGSGGRQPFRARGSPCSSEIRSRRSRPTRRWKRFWRRARTSSRR